MNLRSLINSRRVIQDERIRDAVKSCCQLASGGLVQEGDIEKLASVAQAEWSCWKTGVELTCFGVKLLRICELEGRPFYGAPGLYCRSYKDSGKFVLGKQGEEMSSKGVHGADGALHLDKSVS